MRNEEQTTTTIPVSDLHTKVSGFFSEGHRLVQIGCTKTESGFEINYSFDKDYKFVNLRLNHGEGETLPSISDVYFGAFVYENEIHDLFGVPVSGMNIDFKGTFYRTTVKYPFNADTSREDDSCQSK